MPPKEYYYKVKGILVYEKDKSEEDFSIFISAMDDNHAVMLVREHLRKHAPKGNSIIKGIEKKSTWLRGKGEGRIADNLLKVIAS